MQTQVFDRCASRYDSLVDTNLGALSFTEGECYVLWICFTELNENEIYDKQFIGFVSEIHSKFSMTLQEDPQWCPIQVLLTSYGMRPPIPIHWPGRRECTIYTSGAKHCNGKRSVASCISTAFPCLITTQLHVLYHICYQRHSCHVTNTLYTYLLQTL